MPPLINAVDVEELLQCPVCFELPSGAILQCVQGHGVCQSCSRKLITCPVCRGAFHGTRNFMMEELIDKIKQANTKGKKGKRGKVNKITRRRPPPASPGLFPCNVPQCNEKLPVCLMLRHVRSCHNELLHESMTQDGLAFTRVMDILWVPNMRQVFVMQISDMGLFYLVIDNDADGTVRAWVQMVAHKTVAETFLYELNFHSTNLQTKTVFIDKVQSARLPDTRFLSNKASPICSKFDNSANIFRKRRDRPISRLHLAITFSDTTQPTIMPSNGTKLYKGCLSRNYPELNRRWRFILPDWTNSAQSTVNASRSVNSSVVTRAVNSSSNNSNNVRPPVVAENVDRGTTDRNNVRPPVGAQAGNASAQPGTSNVSRAARRRRNRNRNPRN